MIGLLRRWRERAPEPALMRHPETLLTLEQTATDRRFTTPFRKTYPYEGEFIDETHAGFASCPTVHGMIEIGIEGWLVPADALKLYELAYFAGGDCLELGTYRGLSANVMRTAIVASGRRRQILSIDLDAQSTAAGRNSVAGKPGGEDVLFFTTSADEALETFARARRRFGFCFVDHSHRYEHVRSACERLARVLLPGSFVLFHDYNDWRNTRDEIEDYGVFQGVRDGFPAGRFQPWGVYGCCGLFRFLG